MGHAQIPGPQRVSRFANARTEGQELPAAVMDNKPPAEEDYQGPVIYAKNESGVYAPVGDNDADGAGDGVDDSMNGGSGGGGSSGGGSGGADADDADAEAYESVGNYRFRTIPTDQIPAHLRIEPGTPIPQEVLEAARQQTRDEETKRKSVDAESFDEVLEDYKLESEVYPLILKNGKTIYYRVSNDANQRLKVLKQARAFQRMVSRPPLCDEKLQPYLPIDKGLAMAVGIIVRVMVKPTCDEVQGLKMARQSANLLNEIMEEVNKKLTGKRTDQDTEEEDEDIELEKNGY